MHAVVNRIRLRDSLDVAALAVAQRDLEAQAAQIDGLVAIHVLRMEDGDLVVLVFGDDEAALERTREQMGNAFMREHIMPHAASAPERTTGEVVMSYQRA